MFCRQLILLTCIVLSLVGPSSSVLAWCQSYTEAPLTRGAQRCARSRASSGCIFEVIARRVAGVGGDLELVPARSSVCKRLLAWRVARQASPDSHLAHSGQL